MKLSTESKPTPRPDELSFAWTTGDLRLWVPAPHIVFITMRGYGEATVMKAFAHAAPPPLPERKHYLFYDLYEMDSYDSRLRQEMTKWVMERKPRVQALHALFHSKIVAMGVSVANLALGGIITSHTERTRFQAAFDKALADV